MLGSDVLGSSSSPAFPGSLAAPHDTRILRWISAFSEGAAPRRVAPGRPSHRALEPTAAPAPPLRPTAGRSRPAPPRGGEARQACAILHCRSRPYRRIRNGGSRRPPTHRKKTNSSRWKIWSGSSSWGKGRPVTPDGRPVRFSRPTCAQYFPSRTRHPHSICWGAALVVPESKTKFFLNESAPFLSTVPRSTG